MPTDLSVSATGACAVQAANVPRAGARPGAVGQEREAQRRDEEASAEALRSAIDDAVARLAEKGTELTFQLDNDLGRVIVRLIDRNTREVLRQVPNKEALAVARALRDGGTLGALVSTDA